LVINAQITGWADVDDGEIVIPNNVPQTTVAVETVVKIVDAKILTAVAGQASIKISPPNNTRRLTVAFILSVLIGGEQYSVSGDLTGALYMASGLTTTNNKFFGVIEPTLDPTYTILFQGLGAGVQITLWVMASQTNPIVEQDAPLLVNTNNGSPISITPIPSGNPVNSAASVIATANGTFVLLGSVAPPQSIWVVTLFVTVFGTAIALINTSVGGKYLLGCPSNNCNSLYLGGFQLTNEGLTLGVGAFAAGAQIVAGVTYAIF
jgi:hypothetical protein